MLTFTLRRNKIGVNYIRLNPGFFSLELEPDQLQPYPTLSATLQFHNNRARIFLSFNCPNQKRIFVVENSSFSIDFFVFSTMWLQKEYVLILKNYAKEFCCCFQKLTKRTGNAIHWMNWKYSDLCDFSRLIILFFPFFLFCVINIFPFFLEA